MNEPRILIVGTNPYEKERQSRAFDSYFHYFKKSQLRQIFSVNITPIKGHCSSFFRITDKDMINKIFGRKNDGTIFNDKNLEEKRHHVENTKIKNIRKTPLKRLARGFIWKEKRWCSDRLLNWADEFNPNIIFLAWSNDFFILKIAQFMSKRYGAPIISCIGDDYLFNSHFSINPFYYIYRHSYLKLSRSILFNSKNKEIYIDDKIRDFYNNFFCKNGITVHSAFTEKNSISNHVNNEVFGYFGNLYMGRLKTLIEFARKLNAINKNAIIKVACSNISSKSLKIIKKEPNIQFLGSLIHYEMIKEISSCKYICIFESLKSKRNIVDTRFSLSSKVCEALASNKTIIFVGSKETGVFHYIKRNNCGFTFTSLNDIDDHLFNKINDKDLCELFSANAKKLLENDFSLNENNNKFKQLVDGLLDG